MSKKTFILYNELIDTVSLMGDKDAGALFKMILNYENNVDLNESINNQSNEALIAFSFIKRQLDQFAENYEQTVKARSEAGKKGMAKRWEDNKGITNDNKDITKDNKAITNDNKAITNDNKGITKITNTDTDTDTDTVTDTESKGKKKPSKEGKEKPPTPDTQIDASDLDELVKAKIREWILYKTERNEKYKPTGLKALLTEVKRHETTDGIKATCDVIDLSMANNWKGIIWDRVVKGRDSPNKFQEAYLDAQRWADSQTDEESWANEFFGYGQNGNDDPGGLQQTGVNQHG